jgi:hypothetical protein
MVLDYIRNSFWPQEQTMNYFEGGSDIEEDSNESLLESLGY